MTQYYQIDAIKLQDAKALASVICQAFATGQPDHEGSSAEEFEDYLEYLAMRGAETGLGCVARCNQSGNIIGAVLCDDLADSFSSEEMQTDDVTDPMVQLIKALNLKYFTELKVKPNTYLNIKFIGVEDGHAGKGIANALLSTAMATGKAKGFSYAHTESAGKLSQHIFDNKFGFVELAEIKYADFTYQGKRPIVSTPEHQSVKLMVKTLL